MNNFQSLLSIDVGKKICFATCMVLYTCSIHAVTMYQMTHNLLINAQNLDGLSEKCAWASISGASPRKELLLKLIKSLNLGHMIFLNRLIN